MDGRPIEIRWRDLDAYGHVHHAVYLQYLEHLRDRWLSAVLGLDGTVWDYVVARAAVDYRDELRPDDGEVVGTCRVERVGNSSVTTREELRTSAGKLVAEAELVLVARDESGRSRPLTEEERAAFAKATT